MADAAQTSLFSQLAARYGPALALQLLPYLQGKAVTAGSVAPGVAGLVGPSLLSNVIGGSASGYAPYVSGAIAGGEQLARSGTPAQRIGRGIGTGAFNAALGPYALPYALAKLNTYYMEKSGSPQIREGGRIANAPLLPVEGLESVLGGKSPSAAWGDMTRQIGDIFGIWQPTTGTQFRDQLGQIFRQIPALKGASTQNYNMPKGGYGSFLPDAVSLAQSLGQKLAGYSPVAKKNPSAYALQAENVLLNDYGNFLPMMLPVLQQYLR